MADESKRGIIRKLLAGLLLAALVGDGKPAKKVVPYREDVLEAPMISVSSRGVFSKTLTFTGRQNTDFYYAIYVFVPHLVADSGWTAENCEDRLDLIVSEIVKVLAANRSNAYWRDIVFDGPSRRDNVAISGNVHAREWIPIIVMSDESFGGYNYGT